ncbi:MAG: CubicO group peptidase (beta-lactamase class C family) [Planctomycetaceae bacterium]|jgi:CubicO group peptidase (beta-lactamase class C family)
MITMSESIKRSGKLLTSSFRSRLWCAALVFIIHAASFSDSSHGQAPADNGDEVPLTELIIRLRQENKLVGLAAMVMVNGKVVDSAVDGERKTGSGVLLEIGDRWHLGSVTKSITATMIARLVETKQMKQMKWSDSIGDRFPDASIHEDWKPVTLRQLLTHTAGAPANFSFWVALERPALGLACTKARRTAVLNVLAFKPLHRPGEKFAYSNVGYTIAGAMAEEATGMTWEALVRREVFVPLKLVNSGFGPPKSSAEKLEQPRGHRASFFGGKISANDDEDNTPIIGPAGIVHMTLNDLCTFATEHLRGDLGAGKLLSAETCKLLHRPELDGYACGWVKKEPDGEIPHTTYWHNGSNTMWYALVVFIPEKNTVVAVTSNDGDIAKAEAAAWEIVKANVPAEPPGPEPVQQAEYPKKSPFNAVRWQETQPEVRLGKEWFKPVSLNKIPAAEIVAFSQETYGDQWRKRFEEDLVELLTRMKHPPQDKVTLVVQGSSSKTNVSDVADPQLIDSIGLGGIEQKVRAITQPMFAVSGFRLKRLWLNRLQTLCFQ